MAQRKKPDKVKVYDFLSDAEGKAIPYGVYDFSQNKGWESIGIDHDTAEFALEGLRLYNLIRWGDLCYNNASFFF